MIIVLPTCLPNRAQDPLLSKIEESRITVRKAAGLVTIKTTTVTACTQKWFLYFLRLKSSLSLYMN